MNALGFLPFRVMARAMTPEMNREYVDEARPKGDISSSPL
jgi:hypothetical protein